MDYVDVIKYKLDSLSEQHQLIEKAAHLIEKTLKSDGLVYAFGTGHSHMLTEEIFYRAGGLLPIYPIFVDELMLHRSASTSTKLERLEGLAEKILEGYELSTIDTFLVISNSGINAVPVEAALYAKSKGCNVIVITSLEHSKASKPRNSQNLHLYEIADVVLDNRAPYGDASIEIGDKKVGPISTITGAFLVNAIIIEIVKDFKREKINLPVFLSATLKNGDETNDLFLKEYKKRIPIL